MKWLPLVVMLGVCSIGCNWDNGMGGSDPGGDVVTSDGPSEPTGPSTGIVGINRCGNLGQKCCPGGGDFLNGCNGLLFCISGLCVDPFVDAGSTDDAGTDDGGVKGDSGTTDGGSDGGDCDDPDKGKGDDLHPHGQHCGRVHYCSKQAVVIRVISKD